MHHRGNVPILILKGRNFKHCDNPAPNMNNTEISSKNLFHVLYTLCFKKKNLSKNTVGQYRGHQSEERESSVSPGAMAAAQVEANRSGEEAQGQIRPGGAGPQRTDGGPEKTAKLKPHPSREQMEGGSASGCPSRGR